jgi:hypothetical protein
MSPIERSGGGGGAASAGLVLLFDQTLGADAASIDTGAGGVAGGHKDLIVYFLARTSDAANNVNLNMRLNNDSGANYAWSFVRNDGANSANANSATGATAAIIGQVLGNTAPASTAGQGTQFVIAYDASTFQKAGNGSSAPVANAAGNTQTWSNSWAWSNTAAITQVAIFSASGGNLRAGSVLRIYGTR